VLAPDDAGRSQVDAVLADLTDHKRFAGAARELADEIAGMPSADEVARSVTEMVRDPSPNAASRPAPFRRGEAGG
jgi:hypothetical protein